MRTFDEWWKSHALSRSRNRASYADVARLGWNAAESEIKKLCLKIADDPTASEGYRLAMRDMAKRIQGEPL